MSNSSATRDGVTPQATHSWAVRNLRPLLLGHWRSTCHSMRTLILAALVLLLSTRAAARARDRNRPNRNAACEGRPGAAGSSTLDVEIARLRDLDVA